MAKSGSGTCLLLLASAATVAAATIVHTQPLRDENLLVGVPTGFQLGDQGRQGPNTEIAEYIPRGETVNAWTRMITVQIFHNLGHTDPGQFAERLGQGWSGACPGAQVMPVKDGQENGYRFAVWMFDCPLNRQTGKPEGMFAKIVSGNDALYSVQYAYRARLTNANIPPAVAYLREVKVCDTRRADHPCPAAR